MCQMCVCVCVCVCERERERETDRQRQSTNACLLNKKQSHPRRWSTRLSIQFTVNRCENIAQCIHRNGSRYEHKSHLLLSGDDASSNEGTQFIIETIISLEHTHTSLSTLPPPPPPFFPLLLFAFWRFVHSFTDALFIHSLTFCSFLVATSSPQPSHTPTHMHHITHAHTQTYLLIYMHKQLHTHTHTT